MNLIWDREAVNRASYLRFLTCTCRFDMQGVSLNQENIFKLFKKYNSIRPEIKFDEYFKSGALK